MLMEQKKWLWFSLVGGYYFVMSCVFFAGFVVTILVFDFAMEKLNTRVNLGFVGLLFIGLCG